jgi:phosphoribosylformylglycinamidine synthase
MAMASRLGAALDAPQGIAAHAFWFGEDQARYIVTARDAQAILKTAEEAGLAAIALGETGGDALTFRSVRGESTTALADLRKAHESFFHDWMESEGGLDASDLSGN